jgi:hypothetical protein
MCWERLSKCCIFFKVQFHLWPYYHTATFGRQGHSTSEGKQHFHSTLGKEVLCGKCCRRNGLGDATALQHFFSLLDRNRRRRKNKGRKERVNKNEF